MAESTDMKDQAPLDILRHNCSPRPLREKEDIDNLFTETGIARDEQTDFRQNLLDILQDSSAQTILVHRHRGCGKSTEINKLVEGFDPRWLVVRVQSSDYLQSAGNEAADILLAASICLLEMAEKKGLSLDDSVAKAVLGYFAETTKTEIKDKEAEFDLGGGFDAAAGLLGQLFGIKAKLESSLKYGSRSAESTVMQIRRRKGELAAAFHALSIAIEGEWRKMQGKDPEARLILIVEELDKLGLSDARRIFVGEPHLLGEIPIRAIFTIPVFTFHSPEAASIRANFDHDLALPMIKTRQQDGTSCEKGKTVLGMLIRKRACANVLPDDAMESLIERTGGVLRDIFQAIQVALTFKTVKATGIVGHQEINLALDRMVSDIGLQIAYPLEEDKSPAPLQKKLAEIAKKQDAGFADRSQPDRDIQILLMSGALIEYNGIGWLGVHPLARDYLRAIDMLED